MVPCRSLGWRQLILTPGALPTSPKAALNVPGQVQRKETCVQGLLRLHSLAVSYQSRDLPIEWPTIRRAVLRSKPPFAGILDDMIAFVAAKSGGSSGEFLQYFLAFHRQFVNSGLRAAVPGSLFRVLADLKFPYLAFALLETAFTCPEEHIRHGCCSWVSSGEVSALAKNPESLERMTLAEDSLREVRLRLPRCGISASALKHNGLLKLLVKMDIGIGRWLLSKQEKSAVVFESVADVGLQFLRGLKEVFPKAAFEPFDGLWVKTSDKPAAATAVSASEASALPLYELNTAGELVSLRGRLRASGLEVGAAVSNDGVSTWRLISVQEKTGMVHLEAFERDHAGAFARREVAFEAFIGAWAKVDEAGLVERHALWPSKPVAFGQAALVLRHKGLALVALGHLSAKVLAECPLGASVEIQVKPGRRVVTTQAFGPGELVLTPDSLAVKATSPSEEGPAGAVQVRFKPEEPSNAYWLMPATGSDGVAPFWFVVGSPDESSVNMSSGIFKVSTLQGSDYFGTVSLNAPGFRPKTRLRGKQLPDDASCIEVSIPVLVNSAPLGVGDELRVWRPPAPKRQKPSGAIAVSSLAKKTKADSSTT